jgi:hypothetical protein
VRAEVEHFRPRLLVDVLGLGCDLHMKLDKGNEHERKKSDSAEALFGGADDLLRRAASAIRVARAGDPGGDSKDPAEQETCALAEFGRESGLIR